MENSRRCVICAIDIHQTYFAKNLRSKKTFGKYKK